MFLVKNTYTHIYAYICNAQTHAHTRNTNTHMVSSFEREKWSLILHILHEMRLVQRGINFSLSFTVKLIEIFEVIILNAYIYC